MDIRRFDNFRKKKHSEPINPYITKKNNNKVWRDYVSENIDNILLNGMIYTDKLKVLSVWYKNKKSK